MKNQITKSKILLAALIIAASAVSVPCYSMQGQEEEKATFAAITQIQEDGINLLNSPIENSEPVKIFLERLSSDNNDPSTNEFKFLKAGAIISLHEKDCGFAQMVKGAFQLLIDLKAGGIDVGDGSELSAVCARLSQSFAQLKADMGAFDSFQGSPESYQSAVNQINSSVFKLNEDRILMLDYLVSVGAYENLSSISGGNEQPDE
jgi:hypothetical protein